jgi:NAD(P)-dependent dehydrogenase (short-subunit alcohol dehydrogenase family)
VVVTASAASQFGVMGARFHESIYSEPNGEGDLRGEVTTVKGQYGRSKLANVLFTRQLQVLMPEITACSCHVGAVATSIWDSPFGEAWQDVIDAYAALVMRSIEEGRRTILKCALSQDADVLHKGSYLDGMGLVVEEARLYAPSKDKKLAARLWEVSERLTKCSHGK